MAFARSTVGRTWHVLLEAVALEVLDGHCVLVLLPLPNSRSRDRRSRVLAEVIADGYANHAAAGRGGAELRALVVGPVALLVQLNLGQVEDVDLRPVQVGVCHLRECPSLATLCKFSFGREGALRRRTPQSVSHRDVRRAAVLEIVPLDCARHFLT